MRVLVSRAVALAMCGGACTSHPEASVDELSATGLYADTASARLADDVRPFRPHPDCSPDGKSIAFWSNRDGNQEIYVMNVDGTGQRRLTDNPASDANPAWSPDGTKILFHSDRGGNRDLYVMNADGSNPRAVTSDLGDDIAPDWTNAR